MKYIFCFLFFILISGNIFSQNFDLILSPDDIRLESSFLNGEEVIYLYIRKKQNIESVMLTEQTGFHALRSTEWNTINGDERRELNGRVINDAFSRFSILSSTPIPDRQFGKAFQLLIPSKVVYGNPLSASGIFYMDRDDDIQINIRTFDRKFADPNIGRFQNNIYNIDDLYVDFFSRLLPEKAYPPTNSIKEDISILKKELRKIIINKEYFNKIEDDDLINFLIDSFLDREKNEKRK